MLLHVNIEDSDQTGADAHADLSLRCVQRSFLLVLSCSGSVWKWKYVLTDICRERGGSVVECRTPEREVLGSRPTAAVLCPWARHFTPRKYWLITQEAMAPSQHDWKIVDWDVKPQHNRYLYLKRFSRPGSWEQKEGWRKTTDAFLGTTGNRQGG